MIATSDRKGCAAGAAIAFALDWQQTRPLLEACALNLGIHPDCAELPEPVESQILAEKLAASDAASRAMMFGAQQLLGQQRGLWQVIGARHTEMINCA